MVLTIIGPAIEFYPGGSVSPFDSPFYPLFRRMKSPGSWRSWFGMFLVCSEVASPDPSLASTEPLDKESAVRFEPHLRGGESKLPVMLQTCDRAVACYERVTDMIKTCYKRLYRSASQLDRYAGRMGFTAFRFHVWHMDRTTVVHHIPRVCSTYTTRP